jgi:hypothetical protein
MSRNWKPEVTAPVGPLADRLDAPLRRLNALARSAHARGCPPCKEAWLMAGYCLDPGTVELAMELMESHASRPAVAPPCVHPECFGHEVLPVPVARRMLRLAAWGVPKKSDHLKEATVYFECADGDAPDGFEIAEPPHKRYERWMRPANTAGGLIVSFGRKARVHLTADFDGPDPTLPWEGPRAVEVRMETVALRLPAWSAWVRRKFDDLRALAEMDLEMTGTSSINHV